MRRHSLTIHWPNQVMLSGIHLARIEKSKDMVTTRKVTGVPCEGDNTGGIKDAG